jgi:hypothetical protein
MYKVRGIYYSKLSSPLDNIKFVRRNVNEFGVENSAVFLYEFDAVFIFYLFRKSECNEETFSFIFCSMHSISIQRIAIADLAEW